MTAKPSSMTRPVQVHIIGASGRSGSALCRSLLADAVSIVPVVRDAAKWAATGIAVAPRIADIADAATLRSVLADATAVICCAHARHAGAVIETAPPDARLVFLGSTRKFTKWPDEHGNGIEIHNCLLYWTVIPDFTV